MRIERRLGVRSAYGQLVLIVFLPIAILAMVGGVLVFFETTRVIKSEQDALAQVALIRYEPIIRPLLPSLSRDDYHALTQKIKALGTNGMTQMMSPDNTQDLGRRYISDQMYRIQSNHHVLRVAIMDSQGDVIVSTGVDTDSAWGNFDVHSDSVWRLPTKVGMAYGMPIQILIDNKPKRFWLFVDMDNEPLTIAYYRVILALAITGLITILLLLLILNLYSKRWITPVYEMRLFLQKLSSDNLSQVLKIRTDGEFTLLQRELNTAIMRLNEDFSELKRHSVETETDLQQAFDEMEMQNISIRKARDDALQASATKSSFLANISHELRTPLNAIDGFINLLAKNDNLTGKTKVYIHTIQKSSAHLLALINDVLDFSKIEAGKITLEQQNFNLHQAIYEVADMLSPASFDKSLRMGVLIYNDVPEYLVGDKLRVKQVLMNLLGNAIKFTDTGSVDITVKMDDDELVIQIRDTGRGIDAQSHEKLFQSFSQGDLSITRRYGGTGLGLVISQELVLLMGGSIGFTDNLDTPNGSQGTTFWVRLPACASILESDTLPFMRVAVWLSHPFAMQSMRAYLSATKLDVTYAKSLAQLLDLLAQDSFDWVIADSFGQAGDATALLRQIRSYHKGHLAIYGYQIGFDLSLIDEHKAVCLYEPLSRRALFDVLNNKPAILQTLDYTGISVLAVDDHLPNLLVLEALLAEYGIQVVQAESGFYAIDWLLHNLHDTKTLGVDLIFMDIQMPKMSGIDTALAIGNLIKAHNCPKVPIVALSAYGLGSLTDEHSDNGLTKMGFDAFMTKPISQATLMDILQRFIKNTQAGYLPSDYPPIDNVAQNTPNNRLNNNLDNAVLKKTKELIVIDQNLAIKRANGNQALADELFGMMLKTAKSDILILQQYDVIDDKAVQSLGELSHKIFGATRYTGTPQIEHHAKQLQTLVNDLKAQMLDDTQKKAIKDQLNCLITALQDFIIAYENNERFD